MKFYALLFSLFLSLSFLNAQVIESEPLVEEEAEMEAPAPAPVAETKKAAPVQRVAPKRATRGKVGGRYGFYKGQEWLILPVYDDLPKEYSDFMVAKKDKKYGVIDRLDNEIFPFEYDGFLRPMLDWKTREYADYYSVTKGKLRGILDLKGNVLVPVEYEYLHKIGKTDYLCFGDEKNGYGMMNKDGSIVIEQKYEAKLSEAGENLLRTKKNGKIGIIDFQEKMVLPFEWDELSPIRGVYLAQKDKKYGIMTQDLDIVVEPKYDFIERRFNNIFKVVLDEKLGAINSNFEEIIPPKYTHLKLFHSRYFEAGLDGDVFGIKGVIDTLGNQVLDFKYKKLIRAGGDLIFAKKPSEQLFAVYNKDGVQLVPPTFLTVSGLTRNLSYVMKMSSPEGKKAIIDKNGKVITPFIYDRITAKRNSEDDSKSIITAERDGIVGTLKYDGTENDDFKSVVNKRKQARKDEENKNKNTLKKLAGEWYGITKINGKEYLTNLQIINAYSGVRTIYSLEKGKECTLRQVFKPVLLSDGKTFLTQFQDRYMEVECSNPPSDFNANNMALFGKGILHIKGGFSDITISKYTKKETGVSAKVDYDILRKIKLLKPIEADLKTKIESRPGGLRYPEFAISPETGKVQVISYGSPDDFGFIELKKDGYVFKPARWIKDSNFHLSGILRNVRFIDENGKEKVGDLDVCFVATSKDHFWFREMLK